VAGEEERLKATAGQTGEWIPAARGKAERIRPGFITGSLLFGLCLIARSACPGINSLDLWVPFLKSIKNYF
jgi:hypothetical protein